MNERRLSLIWHSVHTALLLWTLVGLGWAIKHRNQPNAL